MPVITYQEKNYPVADGQTVLEALRAGGAEIASGCMVGACQTCMMKAAPGPDISAWQGTMSAMQVKQRLFVTCIAKPTEDLVLLNPKDKLPVQKISATVEKFSYVSTNIVKLSLKPSSAMTFKPGQFVQLKNDQGVERPYSIASLPDEDLLEFHIELIEGGAMSSYLKAELDKGASFKGVSFQISEAAGTCVYPPKADVSSLLLVGTGTGLAPLWSIARKALMSGFGGKISLYHGSRYEEGLYDQALCRDLAERFPQFEYHACLSGEDKEGYVKGRASDLALETLQQPEQTAVYLCGHPEMVKDMQKKCFLKGSSLSLVYADPFTSST